MEATPILVSTRTRGAEKMDSDEMNGMEHRPGM